MYKSLNADTKNGNFFLCTYNVQPYIVSALKKYLFWFFNGIFKCDLAIMKMPKLLVATALMKKKVISLYTLVWSKGGVKPIQRYTEYGSDKIYIYFRLIIIIFI